MLVITTLAAPAAAGPRLRRRKPRELDTAPEPAGLAVTRVSVIRPLPLGSEGEANAWLDAVAADRDLASALASEAFTLLNRALHAHRTAAGDPTVADVDATRALAIRFGYGTGEDVADGRWQRAVELPERQRRGLLRRDYEALRPQERVAAVLGGRERVQPYEELIVRARGDLDAGRLATAALGLHAALEALAAAAAADEPLGTLGAADEPLAARLGDARATAAAARNAVLAGARDGDLDGAALENAVRAAEAALRRRAVG